MDQPQKPAREKGIKVKDLARELGITSRQLIDRCRAEGYFIQNSITRLKPDVAAKARSWFTGDAKAQTPSDEPR